MRESAEGLTQGVKGLSEKVRDLIERLSGFYRFFPISIISFSNRSATFFQV